jgi:phage shock protein E
MKPVLLTLVAVVAVAAFLWLAKSAVAASASKTDADSTGTKISHADAEEAAKLVAEKKVAVLDVRTPREFAAGHIAGAELVDYSAPDFEKRLNALDKSKTWLVHCAAGGRSTKSLKSLQKLKFQSIVHLDGGLNAWLKAGKPVEK